MTDPVAALKRRGGARRGSTATTPPPADIPADDLTRVMTRANPVVFDPAEMPIVIETNGHVVAADHGEYYLIAAVDGVRHHVPDGCRTPVAQTLWSAGQHVRRDVYLTYLKEIGHELPDPYRTIAAKDSAP